MKLQNTAYRGCFQNFGAQDCPILLRSPLGKPSYPAVEGKPASAKPSHKRKLDNPTESRDKNNDDEEVEQVKRNSPRKSRKTSVRVRFCMENLKSRSV